MNGTPLQLALREMRDAYRNPRRLIGMAVVAAILGYAGPFDTFAELTLAPRIAYWTVIVFVTYGVGMTAGLVLMHRLQRFMHTHWARVLTIGFGASVPVTLVVALIDFGFLKGNPFLPPDIFLLFSYCLAVSLGVGVLHELLARPAPLAASAAAAATMPGILERLPHPQRGRLLALSVRDHYVEVLTDRGRGLVLMRLSDAIKETGTVVGLQIHRSHWVALDAVVRVSRVDGKVAVELPNGDRLPVSRGFLPAARAAGLVV